MALERNRCRSAYTEIERKFTILHEGYARLFDTLTYDNMGSHQRTAGRRKDTE
jgi:hypothetical protein